MFSPMLTKTVIGYVLSKNKVSTLKAVGLLKATKSKKSGLKPMSLATGNNHIISTHIMI